MQKGECHCVINFSYTDDPHGLMNWIPWASQKPLSRPALLQRKPPSRLLTPEVTFACFITVCGIQHYAAVTQTFLRLSWTYSKKVWGLAWGKGPEGEDKQKSCMICHWNWGTFEREECTIHNDTETKGVSSDCPQQTSLVRSNSRR